jgi:hypothetical protein
MESNINYKGISDYSKNFSDKIIEGTFSKKDKIAGEEILSITQIKQVNLFILMNIFQKWQGEVNKIKSPYFDYGAMEVQQAVENLMNVLSRNINISKNDFKPLVEKSVQQAILVIFSPYDYYRMEFFSQSRTIKELKEAQKFIKVNAFLLKAVIEQSERRGIVSIDKEKGMLILDEAMENTHETPEEFDRFIQQFSEIEPLNLSQLYSEKDSNNNSKIDEFFTLNDQFLQEPKPTLADLHREVKIENIKGYITINQRFMFVNDLFNGNSEEFNAAVDELENKQTFDQALEFLKTNYGDKNGWDMESETLVEFLDVVSKRY